MILSDSFVKNLKQVFFYILNSAISRHIINNLNQRFNSISHWKANIDKQTVLTFCE